MRARGLIARQSRRGELADRDAGMRSEHAHVAEQRIDLDLDHLTELGAPAPIARPDERRIMKPKIQPIIPASLTSELLP